MNINHAGLLQFDLDLFDFAGEIKYPIRSARNAHLWNPQYKNQAPVELQSILSAWPKV